jgi:hypothetical protein
MMGVDENFSEYEGGGVMPNTVFPHDGEVTAAEQLRLMSLTGQQTDTRAPLDPNFWYGGQGLDEQAIREQARERDQLLKQRDREVRARYRESPRQ